MGSPTSAAVNAAVHETCAMAPRISDSVEMAAAHDVWLGGSRSRWHASPRAPITRGSGARAIDAVGAHMRRPLSKTSRGMTIKAMLIALRRSAVIPHHRTCFVLSRIVSSSVDGGADAGNRSSGAGSRAGAPVLSRRPAGRGRTGRSSR